ncbi:18951_t:CDS:1 [Funneliformis geosporum]|nr:18951_t:CDS:1 [Funneliformis geosporum]
MRTEHFLNNFSSNGRIPVIIIPPDYVRKLANPTTRSTAVFLSSTPSKAKIKNETVVRTQSTILTESSAILSFFFRWYTIVSIKSNRKSKNNAMVVLGTIFS